MQVSTHSPRSPRRHPNNSAQRPSPTGQRAAAAAPPARLTTAQLFEQRRQHLRDKFYSDGGLPAEQKERAGKAFPAWRTQEGYLEVTLSPHKPFRRHYFVLNNNMLLFGSTPVCRKVEGVLQMEGGAVQWDERAEPRFAGCQFRALVAGGRSKRRAVFFRAKTPEEAQRWVENLDQACTLKIKQMYKLLRPLGASKEAKVVAAKHLLNGHHCAIKIIDRRTCDEKTLQNEVVIMKRLNSDFVVKLFDIFETRKYLYIVMQKCEGGELFDQIAAMDEGGYTEREACHVMHQIASGVKHMHENGIVHRDLKPENILCVLPDSIEQVKIADFGISRIVQKNGVMETQIGSLSYMAPEVLQGHTYDRSVDYWSVGVIMYILLCGYPPFWGESEHQIEQEILKGELFFEDEDWGHVDPHTVSLISRLLDRRPACRANMDDILLHSWMNSSRHALRQTYKVVHHKFKSSLVKRKQFYQHLSESHAARSKGLTLANRVPGKQ